MSFIIGGEYTGISNAYGVHLVYSGSIYIGGMKDSNSLEMHIAKLDKTTLANLNTTGSFTFTEEAITASVLTGFTNQTNFTQALDYIPF